MRATLEGSSASHARRVLVRNAVVQLINIRSEKDQEGEGVFFPCTSTTHIKSMLFIHVIIAYYTFAAAGHEAPLSPLFSLKKYLNLKKGRWLRSEKVREGFSVNRVNERMSSEASTNEPSFFFLSHIQLLSLILRTIATQKKRKKIL